MAVVDGNGQQAAMVSDLEIPAKPVETHEAVDDDDSELDLSDLNPTLNPTLNSTSYAGAIVGDDSAPQAFDAVVPVGVPTTTPTTESPAKEDEESSSKVPPRTRTFFEPTTQSSNDDIIVSEMIEDCSLPVVVAGALADEDESSSSNPIGAGGRRLELEPREPKDGIASDTDAKAAAASVLPPVPVPTTDHDPTSRVVHSGCNNNTINNDGVFATEQPEPASHSLSSQRQQQQPQPPTASQASSSRGGPSEQERSLASLPIDSLHGIASFLTPIEWRNFGRSSHRTHTICGEVFRRVRMHGFRCATEVVTAWKCGQHADAKELCALYIGAGVPIYPHSLGHSYHTLIWRLSVEAKHVQEQQQQEQQQAQQDDSSSSTEPTSVVAAAAVDPFYGERDDLRLRDELILGKGVLTYLEEKAAHHLNSKTTTPDGESEADRIRRTNWRRRTLHAQTQAPAGLPQAPFLPPPVPPPAVRVSGRGTTPRRPLPRSNSFSGGQHNNRGGVRKPNTVLKVHRHLLDQHLLGRPGVDDGEGSMATPPVSLSADFFHPFFSFRGAAPDNNNNNNNNTLRNRSHVTGTSRAVPAAHYPRPPESDDDDDTSGGRRGRSMGGSSNVTTTDDSDSESSETERIHPGPNRMQPRARPPPLRVPPVPPMIPLGLSRAMSASVAILPEPPTSPQHTAAPSGILSNIDLEVYSASSKTLKTTGDDDTTIGKRQNSSHYWKVRFAAYHRCLERHIANHDHEGFEESILDFWDEFLPRTKNIHYYDTHTAVPRISRLDEFLTKPCPKAVGIVQCEIERVKLGSKKSMKGRFFPTYEYRLFIRHRRSDPRNEVLDTEDRSSDKHGRRDTVLMMAKNKGRKQHTEHSGQASKKGSNNYYLSLPQQDDLDLHYKSVNAGWAEQKTQTPCPNGAGSRTCSSEFSGLLGRLQSNFVGTEFQIFTPRSAMTKKSKTPSSSLTNSMTAPRSPIGSMFAPNDDDVLYGSGRHGESSSRRRSRFGRLSRRGRTNADDDLSEPLQSYSSPLTLRRSRSGDATPGGRNRKVSAAESFESKLYIAEPPQPLFVEEEDGAITYTANLLGSRPRIMDVCIPKVNSDGAGMEWKRYLENCKDHNVGGSSIDRLLNHLKQLQQNGQMDEHGRLINPANNDPEVLATDEQEYSPPGDFGLLALQNRPPWWNVELGSFVLNFGGRVSVASVKNFQLCDRSDQDNIMLQFGRIEGRHAFTMDFRYPLTAVQAFAIAISSLQSKISFG